MKEDPLFTEDQLVEIMGSLEVGNAPGLDEIPTDVFRKVATERPEILLDMYNACLAEGIFSKGWKKV